MNRLFLRCQLNDRIGPDWQKATLINLHRIKRRSDVHHTFDKLLAKPTLPAAEIQSFALIAAAAYCSDKLFSRQAMDDVWTRNIRISVPVNNNWNKHGLRIIEKALSFVSGDVWEIEPRYVRNPRVYPKGQLFPRFVPDVVCLFSGGTDSLVGAVDLLESGKKVLLVSHWESQVIAGMQNSLFNSLGSHYGNDSVRHIGIRFQVPRAVEKSTRARSLLFIALGVTSASPFGPEIPLYVPENGPIALNVPLSESRLGSYSTRTTHPFYFHTLGKAFTAVNINHAIINPYYQFTKGEMLARSQNQSLLRELISRTLSCAHPFRWGSKKHQNCGYCYPCLIRRGALNRVGWDKASDYQFDAIGTSEILDGQGKGKDLHELLGAISRPIKPLSLLKSGSLFTMSQDLPHLVSMIERGRQEILDLIDDKGHEALRHYANIR